MLTYSKQLEGVQTMNIIEKYSPQILDEIVFTNQQDEFFIKQFVAGKHHIDHLLLYGAQGTQKTVTAEIIAREIAGNQNLLLAESLSEFLKRGTAIKDYLSNTQFFSSATNSFHQRCVLMVNEIDRQAKLDQLWQVMDENKGRLMLIATTNNLMAVEKSIRSRCTVCNFGIVTHKQFVKRAQHILSSENVVLDDSTVELCLEKWSPKQYDIRDQLRTLQNMISLHQENKLSGAIAQLKRSLFTVK